MSMWYDWNLLRTTGIHLKRPTTNTEPNSEALKRITQIK